LPLAETTDRVAVTFDDGYLETYTNAFPILQRYGIPATVYLATRYIEAGIPFDFGGTRAVVPAPRPLCWPHVRAMVESGLVTVGSHTHSHVNLSRVSLDVARGELALSSRVIGDRLGTRPVHFAYPWGIVTAELKSVVGEYFKTAVAGGTGKNLPGAVDLLALKRIPIQRSDGLGLFRLKLKSFLDGEEFFRTLARRRAGAS
jgi:peptidoglycan/xylan/chitin deacetylase (PgdA/CDA1 family)